MGTEPTLIIGAIVAALNAIQAAAIPLPASVHTIIAVVSIALGAILTRAKVTPVKVAKAAVRRATRRKP